MKNAPSLEVQLKIYHKMLLTRKLEEKLLALVGEGKTRGPLHLCIGQEAAGVAAAMALRKEDYISTTHRGHAHYLGKGLDLYRVVAEIFGRATGYCKGRAGHMLIADLEHRMLGGNALVGSSMPQAAGLALSIQLRKTGEVAMACFGDGAAQTGICHETMNIAALWKLPMIFFLEHNQYGLTAHHTTQSSIEDLSLRANGYGMESKKVDGNDFVAVYKAVTDAAEYARKGGGPTLIEAKTYRMCGFSTSDMGGYQAAEDLEHWARHDPLDRAFNALKEHVEVQQLEELDALAEGEISDAFEKTFSDPFPVPEAVLGRSQYVEG